MAVALVQQGGNALAPGSVENLTVTAGVSGNVVVVAYGYNGGSAVTPTLTNCTFTNRINLSGDASHDNAALYTGFLTGVGGTTLSFNTASMTNIAYIFAEFSGLQQVHDVSGSSNDQVTATPSSGSITPTVTGDLVFGFVEKQSNTAPTGTPAGWSTLTDHLFSSIGVVAAWTTGTTSPISGSWTFAASQNAIGGVTSIKASAGTAVSDPPFVRNRTMKTLIVR